jgi:outer membrane receptor protein involved in Fe transport
MQGEDVVRKFIVTGCRTPLAVGIAIALQAQAGAQEAAPQVARIEEVVVTAMRREQSVQDVPSNISVVSAELLLQTGISDPASLTRVVPGLSLVDEGPRVSGNRNTFSMRGMNVDARNNNDDNPGISQSTVSTYLGEVPVFFPLKLVDLQRVEVLRGPQGTLYGAGSVGGTLRFIPNAPSPGALELDAWAEMSSTDEADDLSWDAGLTFNAPLSETAAFRASVGHEYLSGFIDALGLIEQTGTARSPGEIVLADPDDILGSGTVPAPPREDSNSSDHTYARASFLFEPDDTWRFAINLNYQDISADNRYEDNRFFGSGEEYVTHKAFTDPQDAELLMADLDIEADLGFARLTSSTAIAEVDVDSISDSSGFLRTNLPQYYFGNPRLFAPIDRQQNVDTFTQELRLVSTGERRLDWVAGLFYLRRELKFDLLQIASGANDYTNAYFGTPAPVDFTDVLATGGADQEFTDMAAFGELTWHLTDAWQVTGGVRVFSQELTGSAGIPLPYASRTLEYYYYGTATNDFLLGGINPTEYDADESIFKLNTSVDLNDDTMVYLTFAQGFRPGGANQLPETDPFGNDNRPFLLFEPDEVDSYEIGVKGNFASRYSYSATAFYVDWKNFQANLVSPFGIVFVDNVPSAESQGIELELSGVVNGRFDFIIGYTWIDASITEAFEFVQGDPTTVIPDGNRLPGAAEHQGFAAANYRMPVGGSELILHADVSYRGDTLSNFRDIPTVPFMSFAEFDAFTLVNAAVTWDTGKYQVSLFGDNLVNERGEAQVTTASFYGDRDQGWGVIRPRTFGIRFTVGYD